jgi:hypothetical protein
LVQTQSQTSSRNMTWISSAEHIRCVFECPHILPPSLQTAHPLPSPHHSSSSIFHLRAYLGTFRSKNVVAVTLQNKWKQGALHSEQVLTKNPRRNLQLKDLCFRDVLLTMKSD